MARRIMLEVTHPFHATGTVAAYQPGHLLEPGTDLPEGIRVREVIADVPGTAPPAAPPAAPAAPAVKPARSAGKA